MPSRSLKKPKYRSGVVSRENCQKLFLGALSSCGNDRDFQKLIREVMVDIFLKPCLHIFKCSS